MQRLRTAAFERWNATFLLRLILRLQVSANQVPAAINIPDDLLTAAARVPL
jgi:hypothetical protein